VDWHKVRGENVKSAMHEVDRAFQEYSLKRLVDVLEQRRR
jgi:hypothetical protein